MSDAFVIRRGVIEQEDKGSQTGTCFHTLSFIIYYLYLSSPCGHFQVYCQMLVSRDGQKT